MSSTTRPKRSKIWTTDKTYIQNLLNTNHSICDILKILGFNAFSGNHRTLRDRIKTDNLDLSLFNINKKQWLRTFASTINKKINLNDIFIKDSKYTQNQGIKQKILKHSMLPYKCSICSNEGFHNNQPLSLQLDHINGISNDNRIENLRFLCPNCHTQTPTYSGKKNKKYNFCCVCNQSISIKAEKCKSCARKNKTILDWPPLEEILELCKNHSFTHAAKILNRSDNSIRKFLIRHNIDPKKISTFCSHD